MAFLLPLNSQNLSFISLPRPSLFYSSCLLFLPAVIAQQLQFLLSVKSIAGIDLKMRFSLLASAFLASLSLVAASPLLGKDEIVEVVEVVYDYPKIRPKIFIISMVRRSHFPVSVDLTLSSSYTKPTSGMQMIRVQVALVISLPKTLPSLVSLHYTQTRTVWRMVPCAN